MKWYCHHKHYFGNIQLNQCGRNQYIHAHCPHYVICILSGQATKQEADDVHWSPGETGQNIPYPVINIPFPGAGQCREHSGGHLRDIPQVKHTIKIH